MLVVFPGAGVYPFLVWHLLAVVALALVDSLLAFRDRATRPIALVLCGWGVASLTAYLIPNRSTTISPGCATPSSRSCCCLRSVTRAAALPRSWPPPRLSTQPRQISSRSAARPTRAVRTHAPGAGNLVPAASSPCRHSCRGRPYVSALGVVLPAHARNPARARLVPTDRYGAQPRVAHARPTAPGCVAWPCSTCC